METSNLTNPGGIIPPSISDIIVQVLIYGVVLLLALLAIYLIAVILSFIVRLFFRQVRFIVMFVLSLAAIAVFAFFVFIKPYQVDNGDSTNSNVMEQVVEQYKGLYPSNLPMVAWRISDITDEPQTDPDAVPANSGGRIYKVSYLPFGELIVQCNPKNGQFEIKSSADGKTISQNIKVLTDGLIGSVKNGAVKAFEGIQSALLNGVDLVKEKTSADALGKQKIFDLPE